MVLIHIYNSVIATASFVFTIATVASLVTFLSTQNNPNIEDLLNETEKNAESKYNTWPLVENMMYCYLFVFLHTILAVVSVKKIIKIGLGVLQRSIYVGCSALTLQLLIRKWQTVVYYTMWILDTRTNDALWWLFSVIHFIGWSIIFGGCIMMDLGEILGIKQVWYSIRGLAEPITYKSKELQSLYSHMRHPSLIGFVMILWIHPHMTLDRLLLAFIFTVYMLGFFQVDRNDYAYQREQLMRKRETVNVYQYNVVSGS